MYKIFFANKKITDTIFWDRTKLKNRSWDLSTFEDYDGSTNHDIFMHRCILKCDQELRISARLNWTLGLNNWKKADFLLKSDPKLGGVLMYNTSMSGKITVSIINPFLAWPQCWGFEDKNQKSVLKVSQFQNVLLVSSNLPKKTTKNCKDFCPSLLKEVKSKK